MLEEFNPNRSCHHTLLLHGFFISTVHDTVKPKVRVLLRQVTKSWKESEFLSPSPLDVMIRFASHCSLFKSNLDLETKKPGTKKGTLLPSLFSTDEKESLTLYFQLINLISITKTNLKNIGPKIYHIKQNYPESRATCMTQQTQHLL